MQLDPLDFSQPSCLMIRLSLAKYLVRPKESELLNIVGEVEGTGLYYLQARYYDPSIGRFLNEDTYEGQIDNPLSQNLYTYVSNNPLIYSDPTGHYTQVGTGGVGGSTPKTSWYKALNNSTNSAANKVDGAVNDFCTWFGCADIAQGLSMMGPEFTWLAPAEDAILLSEGAAIRTESKFLTSPAKKMGY